MMFQRRLVCRTDTVPGMGSRAVQLFAVGTVSQIFPILSSSGLWSICTGAPSVYDGECFDCLPMRKAPKIRCRLTVKQGS